MGVLQRGVEQMDEGNKHDRGFISVSPDIYPLSGYK